MIRTAYQDRIHDLLDLTAPLPESVTKSSPLSPVVQRVAPHPAGCWCIPCWNAGLRYGEWKEQKRLEEL